MSNSVLILKLQNNVYFEYIHCVLAVQFASSIAVQEFREVCLVSTIFSFSQTFHAEQMYKFFTMLEVEKAKHSGQYSLLQKVTRMEYYLHCGAIGTLCSNISLPSRQFLRLSPFDITFHSIAAAHGFVPSAGQKIIYFYIPHAV